ncbi:hypothetical protein CHGG_00910 [Chaetomium globosum CBS 148.51]|uniref:PNPLA domain-containing protein n=1 Tax=Chaetomium globosum (strain ATCC 6205 / CBS 148.51 / DSM 1962 / NBRC 6347 / NRRL 1970) TaxID=306901 RepID=Q2HFU4_CHAGB|nr:uncharacterized protein CHGG_00910 [Chaetomium globosum CBS 148.51]EAQ92675.1 hypothetical protein CHGG_00910 [Chaetomium globosum CBS 148.51]
MAPSGDEAVNLLSLDGGGVRGVSSLVILDAIMTKMKDKYNLDEIPKPCDYFHMIAGTSTGGLIAIMLGRLRMSTREALDEYDNCAAKIFSKSNRKKWSVSERFRATALQEAVEGIVKARGLGETMWDPERPDKGKAIVCVMPSKSIEDARVVRSFPGDPGEPQWDRNITIWQAARATTAASSFFKPQKLGDGPEAQTYIDAAIGANNPIKYLLDEAVLEFGTGRRLGCVVSIGTGTRHIELGRAITGLKNFVQAPGWYIHLIKALKSKATDAEEAHRQLQSRLVRFPGSYFRFNVPEAAEKVGLHHYEKMPELKSLTAGYLGERAISEQVQKIAEVLKTDVFHHGLMLGHLSLDEEQVILSNPIQKLGMSSSFFTGRQDILQSLDSLFSERNTGGKPRRECLLHGMGGVGKTQIALKVGEVFEDRFKYIFFIDGSMPSTICQSYAQICKRHNLGHGSTEAMEILAMQWMEELTEEWLMIFDDCNLVDRRSHLPGRGKGNIIYTSRLTSLKHGLPPDCVFEITPFGVPDAVELLQRASGFQGDPEVHPDAALAEDIVKELGCLPLAIDKAAASIRDGMMLDYYLTGLRTRKVGILHDPRFKDKNVENPTVYAALELSYAAMEARRRRGGRQFAGRSAVVALKLLGVLCFYHYKDFPITALESAAKERYKRKAHLVYPLSKIMEPPDSDLDCMLEVKEDGSWDVNWVSVGLKVLETFSLVKRDRKTSTVSMHVLVHSWARHRMEQDMYLRYCLVAKIILSESIVLSWRWLDKTDARLMGPHAAACLVRRSKELQHDEYEAQLQLKRGWMYELNKGFEDAEREFLKCMRFWKVEQGNDSWSVINTLQRLAALYHEMGRLGDAEMAYLETANRMHKRIKECEDAMAAVEEAEQNAVSQDPSSEARSTCDPENLPQKPSQMRNRSSRTLRRLLENSRDGFSKGKEVVKPTDLSPPPEQIVAKTERPQPPDDIDQLWTRYNILHGKLAKVYMDQDRYGMGKRMLLKAAENLESLLPEDDPELLRVQNEARSITTPGDYKFWAKRLKHWYALEDEPDNAEYRDPEVGWQLMVAYADCLLKNKIYDEAYRRYCEAKEIFERIYGPYDKKILEILRRMVVCKIEANDGDLAVGIARECLGRSRRSTSMDEAWKESKAELEVMKAELGEDHILVKRFTRFVGNGPAKTREEQLKKLSECFGPDSTLAKQCQKDIEDERQTTLAEAKDQDDQINPAKPRRRIYLCACGELEHAEGSWQNEAHGNEAAQSGNKECSVRDGGDGERPQSKVWDAPRDSGEDLPTATTPLNKIKGYDKDRWLNIPMYFAGMY